MGDTNKKLTIRNNSNKSHPFTISYGVIEKGNIVGRLQKLAPSETGTVESGDHVIIISDATCNYQMTISNRLVLHPFQVNNQHPEFPEMTVAVYHMTMSKNTTRDGNVVPDIDVEYPPDPMP